MELWDRKLHSDYKQDATNEAEIHLILIIQVVLNFNTCCCGGSLLH
jgi:hypothetical protein